MSKSIVSSRAAFESHRQLTLRERVAQTSVVQLSRHAALIKEIGAEAFLVRYPVGGFFVGGEVIKDGTNRFEFIAEQVAALQSHSRIPLLIAADLENGCGDVIPGLTPMPFPMCLAAANDEALAYDYGQACAEEGLLAGINWNYAPLVDLCLHPLSANIGNRSLGIDPARVGRLSRQLIRGLQDHRMAACAKTFPGDGTDFRDQHLTTTSNFMDEQVWWDVYGRLFQDLFDSGLATVMTGHFSLPALQAQSDPRGYLPATICAEITTRLLKEKMRFGGLVVSDGFGMAGILNWGPKDEMATQAVAAGTDMILFNDLTFLDRMEQAMAAGEVTEDRLNDALNRIWKVKETYAIAPATSPQSAEAARAQAAEVGLRTARAGATLAWDRAMLLPISPAAQPRLLLIAITPNPKAFARFETLAAMLREQGFHVDLFRNFDRFAAPVEMEDYDRVIYLLERQFHRPLGTMDFFGTEAATIWGALLKAAQKTIVLNFGSPFVIQFYFEAAPTALNFYSSVPSCLQTAVELLTGAYQATGQSPVNLGECCRVINAGACAATATR